MSVSWVSVDPQLHEAYTALSSLVSQAGGHFTLTSTIRTFREQSFLYKRYLAGQSGGLPAAPPNHSAHEYGWAFDAITSPWSWQADVGKVFESWGGVWGATKDPVHFELQGAGALAYQIGEGTASASTPDSKTDTGAGVGLLPPRWKKYIYSLEDFGISLIPGVGYVELIAGLLKLGYSDSQVLNLLTQPVQTLHDWFPSIPF
jgi:hypothetical protein